MSMELAAPQAMTSSQLAFCELVSAGVDKNEAVVRAGYSDANPSAEALRLLQQPKIIAAIQIGVARELMNAAPMALKLLRDITVDELVDKRLRVVCAKTLLDRAGHIAPKASAPGQGGDIPLNEMSMTDLRALADKLEGELATRAKPVSSAMQRQPKPQTIEDIM